ncbi:AAA family ATPase [Kineosporia sp. NBRC 101731]|uniref:AAA family ATPase n=1 Tax=Kineosporia sp. NBRC 101731 TaxID=3032199 RepID=UPI0024A5E043|nr:AAA family ATPase [Kineosporia sp. NBRC 101731]GLY33640.1 ABC transporter, ATP-binding protein [Kineosporia sp. NBRC 101731]
MLVRRAYVENADPERWPYTIPAVGDLAEHGLTFRKPITFLVGENGSGKSTVAEALAEAFGLDPYGGKAGTKYASSREKSQLGQVLKLTTSLAGQNMMKGPRKERSGFFLRAETAMTMMSTYSDVPGYWSGQTDEMSHGEGFLTVLEAMFARKGFYVLDEPESALSFNSSLRLVELFHRLGRAGAQVVCATHSPILASTPGAAIYEFSANGLTEVAWDDLMVVDHWRRYLNDPQAYLRHLL